MPALPDLDTAESLLELSRQLLAGERRVLDVLRGLPVTELSGEMLALCNQGLIMGALRVLVQDRARAEIAAVRDSIKEAT